MTENQKKSYHYTNGIWWHNERIQENDYKVTYRCVKSPHFKLREIETLTFHIFGNYTVEKATQYAKEIINYWSNMGYKYEFVSIEINS